MKQEYVLNYLKNNLPKVIMPNYDKVEIKAATLGNQEGLIKF